MLTKEEKRLLIEVAVQYYIEGKTQNEIAKNLYLSRTKVSRLLKESRERGIVNIEIKFLDDEYESLIQAVKSEFKVNEVIISKSFSDSKTTLKEAAKVAAKSLSKMFHDGITIGITWGNHVNTTVSYVDNLNLKNVTTIEMYGSISCMTYDDEHLSVGQAITKKLKGKLYTISSPVYIAGKNTRKDIVNTPVIKTTLDKIKECDIVITGMSTIHENTSQILWTEHLNESMRKEVIKKDGVGFILARYFDKYGNFIKSKVNDSVIGITEDEIKSKKIFAIATGEENAKAIFATLYSGMLDTIVTDEKTMKKVLEMKRKDNKNDTKTTNSTR